MIECLIRGNILLFQLFIFFDRDMKNYLPVIILICNYLWWPRYDLEVALSPGPSNYQVVEKNFYTLKGGLINYNTFSINVFGILLAM
jgi:hypothetical protein